MKYREQTSSFYLTVETPAGPRITQAAVCDLHWYLMSGTPRAYIATRTGIAGRIKSYFQAASDPSHDLPCAACSGAATIDRPASVLLS